MKIEFIKGNKGNGDRIFTITTKEKEWFSIYKLSILINQLTINELKINKEKIEKSGKFFFKMAIEELLDMSAKRMDWADEKNLKYVKSWCKKYMLNFEKIEPELRKVIQTKLEDFKND